jgi:hypothetical protein
MRSSPATRPLLRHPAWPLTTLGALLASAALLTPRAEAATGPARVVVEPGEQARPGLPDQAAEETTTA